MMSQATVCACVCVCVVVMFFCYSRCYPLHLIYAKRNTSHLTCCYVAVVLLLQSQLLCYLLFVSGLRTLMAQCAAIDNYIVIQYSIYVRFAIGSQFSIVIEIERNRAHTYSLYSALYSHIKKLNYRVRFQNYAILDDFFFSFSLDSFPIRLLSFSIESFRLLFSIVFFFFNWPKIHKKCSLCRVCVYLIAEF